MFSMQCRKKTLQLKITKKKSNVANFINIYTNIYTYIICGRNDSKYKWWNKLNIAAWPHCWQWLLCSISSSSPWHRLETQHFDECNKHKQSGSFFLRPEHTIWVSRHRTLGTQCLHLDVFLWKQYIILASYKYFCNLQSFCSCTPLLTLA